MKVRSGLLLVQINGAVKAVKLRVVKMTAFAVIALASVSLVSFNFFNVSYYNADALRNATATLQNKEIEEVSDSALLAVIRENGIQHEYLVLAQAIVESHQYKSKVFRHTNNLFGMRYPGRRLTTASGLYLSKTQKIIKGDKPKLKPYIRQFNFSVYDNWYDAVRDYKIWQENTYKTNENYPKFLKRVYATAPAYHTVIERLARDLKEKYEPVQVAVQP